MRYLIVPLLLALFAFHATGCGSKDVEETCQCTEGPCCDGCNFLGCNVMCREAAGACDVAEFCTGVSAECPDDELAPATVVCREAAGPCDVAEYCTGESIECPADEFASTNVMCREADGPCDVAEYCTGEGPECPPDELADETVLCREAAGPCDVAEYCTGESAACPADEFEPETVVCREAAGPCDVAEYCTGQGAQCPADEFAADTVVCREAAGPCDAVEHCTGDSAACPEDGVLAAGAVCKDAGHDCELDAVCDGVNKHCPVAAYASEGVTCTPSYCKGSGVCDGGGECIDLLAPECDGACSDFLAQCCDPGYAGLLCDECVVFVDASSDFDGADPGLTWSTAFTYLQSALDAVAAAIAPEEGDADFETCQVWVAEGTYTPDFEAVPGSTNSRTFKVLPGTSIYGGFTGAENTTQDRRIDARDGTELGTVLSGFEVAPGGVRAHNVVTVFGDSGAGVVLDGLRITGGQADDRNWPHGAGVDAAVDLTVVNCQLVDNEGTQNHGVAIRVTDAELVLNDSLVADNSTYSAVFVTGGSLSMDGTELKANRGSPALRLRDADGFITRSVFFGNVRGAIYRLGKGRSVDLLITDSLFVDNSSSDRGGALLSEQGCGGAEVFVTRSTFRNNSSGDGGGAIGVRGRTSVVVADNLFEGNTTTGWNSGGAIVSLGAHANSTRAIVGNRFVGNHATRGSSGGGGAVALKGPGLAYFAHNELLRNISQSGGGGLFVGTQRTEVANNVFVGNTATGGGGGGVLISGNEAMVVGNLIAGNIVAGEGEKGMGAGVRFTGHSSGIMANNTVAMNVLLNSDRSLGAGVYAGSCAGNSNLSVVGEMAFANNLFWDNRSAEDSEEHRDVAIAADNEDYQHYAEAAYFTHNLMTRDDLDPERVDGAPVFENAPKLYDSPWTDGAEDGFQPLDGMLYDVGDQLLFGSDATPRVVTEVTVDEDEYWVSFEPAFEDDGFTKRATLIVAWPAGHTDFEPDFSLAAGSPGIDAGEDTLAPPTDLFGARRVGRSDIGAIESGGAARFLDSGLCQAPVVWPSSEGGNDHLYAVCPVKLNWRSARLACESLEGNLVHIESAEENEFVASLLDENAWIGLHVRVFSWVWPNGDAPTFTAWLGAQNSLVNNAVQMRLDGTWEAMQGFLQKAFVCEFTQ